ncbi:MAG: ATP-binding protein [Vampirovibrionales bacterium]|nr:ATP-binding protein [Vampirovibrionales bacterium]
MAFLPPGTSSSEASRQASETTRTNKPRLQSWLMQNNRLWLCGILAATLTFAGTAVVVHQQFQHELKQHQQAFGQLMTAVAAVRAESSGTDALSNKKRLAEVLIETSEDIAAVEFYDTDANLIFETHRPLTPEQEAQLVDYAAPWQGLSGEEAGELHIKLTGGTWQQLGSNIGLLIMLVFAAAWALSVSAMVLAAYLNNKQLKSLAQGVKQLSGGAFGTKIETSTLWGEIRTLAEGFNQMSARLKSYEAQNAGQMSLERHKLQAVLGSIADGVVVCDSEGTIQLANEAAAKLLEADKPSQLTGLSIRDYVDTQGERCFEAILATYQQAIGLAPALTPDVGIQNVAGTGALQTYTVELSGKTIKAALSPLKGELGSGQPQQSPATAGFVMTLNDVTRQAEVDRLKTQFISNVSHELRTPVTTIKSYVDTVFHHGDELDEQTRQEFLETIHIETDRLKKLVNDILDFSRLENGNIALEKSPQNVVPLINLTVQSVKMLAQQKNITLTTAIESNLPEVSMNSDSIERVLRNLLSNAIKYTDEGGRIKIRAEVSALEGRPALEITVADTGMGIAAEHLPHIYDRFYRVENQVHTVKGTGLGLHLVKVAIEEHHEGQVFVNSQLGAGSTFGFRLPLTQEALKKTAEKQAPQATLPAASQAP